MARFFAIKYTPFGTGTQSMTLPWSLTEGSYQTEIEAEPVDRAEHLLRTMRKALSHDLPNQLVVLQSLVHLLQTEETSRLSLDGQEYTQRIQNVTRKATGLVTFLKEMCRLVDYVARPEHVALDLLTRELKTRLMPQTPRLRPHFVAVWEVPSVWADPRLLQQALYDLLQLRLEAIKAPVETIHAVSRRTADGVEIAFRFSPAPAEPWANRPALIGTPEPPPAELLAREYLALSGARLTTPRGLGEALSILILESSPHG